MKRDMAREGERESTTSNGKLDEQHGLVSNHHLSRHNYNYYFPLQHSLNKLIFILKQCRMA